MATNKLIINTSLLHNNKIEALPPTNKSSIIESEIAKKPILRLVKLSNEKPKIISPFSQLEEQAKNIHKQWKDIYRDLYEGKKDNSNFDKKKFRLLDKKVEKAFKQLKHDIKNPMLILATTGTTSSGKSTIINLLCGADIMPRMSQEMSAGVVNIKHSYDGKRYLKVHNTKGALWDCGEWRDMSDKEIKDKLTEVMDKFNKNKGKNQPDTPIIDLTFPINFFNNSDLLFNTDIPKNTIFKLMDLPGLRNHRDQTNAKVIENCRHALCLVAYDMQETDENKRIKLINEVLQQIKYMGGSPARMMFVLNRIDVFLNDDDPERRQKEMIKKVQKEIYNTLHKELPEHRESLASLSYSLLSSLAALRALKIKKNADRNNEAKELESEFQKLIGKEVISGLPREVSKWEEVDFDNISDAAWKNSHGSTFFSLLNEHIKKHFHTLVLPSILDNFKKEVRDAIGEASRTTYSVIKSSKEAYEKTTTDLNKKDNRLRQFFEETESELKRPLNNFLALEQKSYSDFESFVQELHDTDIYHNRVDFNKMRPLVDWYYSLRKIQGVFEVMCQILEGKTLDFSSTIFGILPNRLQESMHSICRNYTALKEIDNESQLKLGLSYFYNWLNEMIAEIFYILTEVENRRINESMNYLLDQYLDYSQENIDKIAPQWKFNLGRDILSNLTTPSLKINKISDTVGCNSKEQKAWGAIFLEAETSLPDPKSIQQSYMRAISKQLDNFSEPFSKMVLDYFSEFNDIVQKAQGNIRDDFDYKLKEAHNKHNKDKIELYWQPLHNKAEALNQSFKNLKI